jgi:hypothetical protein
MVPCVTTRSLQREITPKAIPPNEKTSHLQYQVAGS